LSRYQYSGTLLRIRSGRSSSATLAQCFGDAHAMCLRRYRVAFGQADQRRLAAVAGIHQHTSTTRARHDVPIPGCCPAVWRRVARNSVSGVASGETATPPEIHYLTVNVTLVVTFAATSEVIPVLATWSTRTV
jgi:hypothetical protein